MSQILFICKNSKSFPSSHKTIRVNRILEEGKKEVSFWPEFSNQIPLRIFENGRRCCCGQIHTALLSILTRANMSKNSPANRVPLDIHCFLRNIKRKTGPKLTCFSVSKNTTQESSQHWLLSEMRGSKGPPVSASSLPGGSETLSRTVQLLSILNPGLLCH